jgi:nucleoside-diphosphate-sugar epimerase
VFNLCGYIDHSTYGDHGRDVFDVHFVGLMNLLDQVKGPSLKCFLQVGSSDEYGGAQSPQIETIREAAISPYSAAKVACTHLIQSLFKSESFPGVVVRPFLVYGPGQGMSRFVPQVISGCMNDVAFPVTEGKQLRDFCYVEDVVEGMLIAAVTPKALGEVINVASGVPISIRNVIELIISNTGKGTADWGSVKYRPGENMKLYADIGKAKKILKWQAKTSLKEGLMKTVNYYKSLQGY